MNTAIKEFDVVVIGAGPSGLAAALSAARNGARVLLVEKNGYLGGNMAIGLPLLGYLDRDGKKVIGGIADEFMKDMDRTLIFAMEPDDFVERLSEVHPDAGFDEVLGNNRDAVDSLYQKESELISYFGYSFVFNTRMPGRYYDGNAVDFIDGNPSWKVDAFRLMEDDLVLEAVTRKLNVWVFVLTFVLIILLLQLFAKVFARR